jgi:hypothetical protein
VLAAHLQLQDSLDVPELLGTLVDCGQDGLAERWGATLHGDKQVGVGERS